MEKSRVLVIGLDGAGIDVLLKGINEGSLTNMAKLVEEGGISTMIAPVPPTTPVSMSSIMTGDSPGKHGVYSFEKNPARGKGYNNYSDIDSTTIFEAADPEKKVISINTPMTYPPPEINGKIISGFPAGSRNIAWPPDINVELKESGYRIEPIGIDEGRSEYIQDVFELAEKRFRKSQEWISEDWDLFLMWFTGDARLQHFIEDEEVVMDFYRKVDKYIGDFLDYLNEEVTVMIVSDHGFNELDVEADLGKWLEEEGYLPPQDMDWSKLYGEIEDVGDGTVAYPGGAYMGGIHTSEDTRDEIAGKLEELKYEGRPVFRKIYSGEELYGSKEAPDIIPVPVRGFNYTFRNSENIFNEAPEEVKVPDKEGVLITNREDVNLSDPQSEDVSPTIADILGLEFDFEGDSLVN